MKKQLFLLALVCLSGLVFGGTGNDERKESMPYQAYELISDSVNPKIPAGKCVVKGTIYYHQYVEQDGIGDYVSRLSDERTKFQISSGKQVQRFNRKDGSFEILLDTSERYLIITQAGSDKSGTGFETVYLENYPFLNQHEITVVFTVPLALENQFMEVDKPVIYAYGEHVIDFTLTLKAKGKLNFVYPVLDANSSWKMKTGADGMLTDAKGKQVPYLFWESKQNPADFKKLDPASSEVLAQKDLISHLEKSLEALGLNAREQTDFITYWGPKMSANAFLHIQFLVDESCSVVSEMDIEPKPDHLRRIFMIYTGYEQLPSGIKTKTLEIDPFSRSGFTLVEWGGTELTELQTSFF